MMRRYAAVTDATLRAAAEGERRGADGVGTTDASVRFGAAQWCRRWLSVENAWSGLGPYKAARYGAGFLQVVAQATKGAQSR